MRKDSNLFFFNVFAVCIVLYSIVSIDNRNNKNIINFIKNATDFSVKKAVNSVTVMMSVKKEVHKSWLARALNGDKEMLEKYDIKFAKSK